MKNAGFVLIGFLATATFADLTPTTILDNVPGSTTISNLVASSGVSTGGGGVPSDYETVKANAASGASHATSTSNPHGVTAQQAFAAGPTVEAAARFMDSVTFSGSFDTNDLRKASGGSGFSSVKPAMTQIFAEGIVHTPFASNSAAVYDVFYAFPHKSGVFAMLSDIPNVPAWAQTPTKPNYTPAEVGAFPASSGQTLQQAVNVISVHLNAEDARDIVTNYNSAVNMPSRRLEYKEPDGPNAGQWRVVWDELTRWNWLTGTYLPSNFYTKAEVDARTDHIQWGLFDSQTGNFSPEKTVQISSDRVILCKGASYQRTATAQGSYWVWTSNEPYSITGVESNGYFRIEDAEGNTTFEIVKGDKVTAAATAGGVSTEQVMGITHLHISYPIEADTHPTLEICNDLTTHDWKAETDGSCLANVTWTGVSGNYSAEVWGKDVEDALFVKATYQRGSDPYVRYAQAIALQTVKIGNTIYYVGTATISGHTVLTLSLTPPAL